MNNFDSLVDTFEDADCLNLYKFLTTNYDISDLAGKIYATKNAPLSILNLKKIGSANY